MFIFGLQKIGKKITSDIFLFCYLLEKIQNKVVFSIGINWMQGYYKVL